MKKNAFFLAAALCAAPFFAQGRTAAQLCEAAREKQAFQEWYAAIELYQEAAQKNPAYAQVWAGLAECSYSLGEYSVAISYADKALKFSPVGAEMPNLKGFAKIGLGEFDEARKIFAEVLAKFPNDVDSRFGLAELDIYDGKISSAEQTFKNALRRQPENKRALLSLAVISQENGKEEQARRYLRDALFYHGNSPDAHYFEGYLAAKRADFQKAEESAREAIRLAPDYDKARELLAFSLFKMARHEEAIEVCDFRLRENPSRAGAWFIKGISQVAQDKIDEAAESFAEGLKIDPFDEISRAALESLAKENLPADSLLRESLARFHEKSADDAAKRYFVSEAAAEYRLALALNPENLAARKKYAELLLNEGRLEKFFAQLDFLAQKLPDDKKVRQWLSAFRNKNSILSKWKNPSADLEKKRYKIGVFCEENMILTAHPDAEKIAANSLASIMNAETPVFAEFCAGDGSKFAQTFSAARSGGCDYFLVVKTEESADALTVSADMFASRTGAKAASFSVYRSGNGRFAAALRKLSAQICQSLSLYGNILARSDFRVLIDVGRLDGAKSGQTFKIVRKGELKFADFSTALSIDEGDVIGTLALTEVGDEFSEGAISLNGFSDFVSQGNLVLPVEKMPLMAVPSREEGEEAESGGGEKPSLAIPVRESKNSALVELLRSIERSVAQ